MNADHVASLPKGFLGDLIATHRWTGEARRAYQRPGVRGQPEWQATGALAPGGRQRLLVAAVGRHNQVDGLRRARCAGDAARAASAPAWKRVRARVIHADSAGAVARPAEPAAWVLARSDGESLPG
jgi:hypothetical protein